MDKATSGSSIPWCLSLFFLEFSCGQNPGLTDASVCVCMCVNSKFCLRLIVLHRKKNTYYITKYKVKKYEKKILTVPSTPCSLQFQPSNNHCLHSVVYLSRTCLCIYKNYLYLLTHLHPSLSPPHKRSACCFSHLTISSASWLISEHTDQFIIVLKSAQHSIMRTCHSWFEQPFTNGCFNDFVLFCSIWLCSSHSLSAFLMCSWTVSCLKAEATLTAVMAAAAHPHAYTVLTESSAHTGDCYHAQPLAQKRRLKLTGQGRFTKAGWMQAHGVWLQSLVLKPPPCLLCGVHPRNPHRCASVSSCSGSQCGMEGKGWTQPWGHSS